MEDSQHLAKGHVQLRPCPNVARASKLGVCVCALSRILIGCHQDVLNSKMAGTILMICTEGRGECALWAMSPLRLGHSKYFVDHKQQMSWTSRGH